MDKARDKVPARYVALLVQHLEHEGFDCDLALSCAGINRTHRGHADALLPASQLIDVVRRLAQASHRSDLGLSIGSLIGTGQLGEVGRAMLCCATLRDAWDCCARYYELITPSFSMSIRTVGACVELSWLPILPLPYDLIVLSYDIALMAVHNQLTCLLRNDLPSYDIYPSTPAPTYVERYRQLRPARCHFSQGGLPRLSIMIDVEVLKTAMPMANATDLIQAEQRLQARLSTAPRLRDWKAWVLLMLRESHDHQPTQGELSALLSMSASTLSRHLAAQGCSYRDLSMTVRYERACVLLQEGRSTVGDIAKRLGYAHASNFIRAFKVQTGMSPLQYVEERITPLTVGDEVE